MTSRFWSAASLLLVWALLPGSAFPQVAPSAGAGRDTAHYTADRPVAFRHMRLELTFTPEGLRSRTCEGRVEYTLARGSPASQVRLDAADMQILGVELGGEKKPPVFSYDDKVLTVSLPQPVPPGREFRLAVKYRLADPPKGMHFVVPTASRPKRPLMVYTMSEPLEARYWFPTHDWPNERWTSDILVTVPAGLTAVANGVLRSREPAAGGKAVIFHWHNTTLTDPHLVGMAVGELVELKDTWKGRPLVAYTLPGTEAAARYSFRNLSLILDYYSRRIGVDFPYPGYTHVVVADHHHGGMEHAGFSFISPDLFNAGLDGDWPEEDTENRFVAHMLAHQWFAGLVNYRSVAQAWLNEGYATMLNAMWTGQADSPERFACLMHERARNFLASDTSETGKPLVLRDLADPGDVYQFDGSKIYFKGAWVLTMLRHQLGEEVFWRATRKYLTDHRWGAVETGDLRRAQEETSGRDLEQFFQQWVYGRGVPRLEVIYAWEPGPKRARVTLRQTQKADAATPAFVFPLDLYFRTGKEEIAVTVQVSDPRHEWTFDFPAEPEVFCVDPHGGLLKTLAMKRPRAMLRRQAEAGPTALSRLTAVEELARDGGPEAVATLARVLGNAGEFWVVRRAAAAGLGRMQTEAALAALLVMEKKGIDPPRVLAGAVEALGGYVVSREAHQAVLGHAESKSLAVQTAAVTALGRLRAGPDLGDQSLKHLEAAAQKPTRRAVRGAALSALAAREDPRAFEAVFRLAQPGGDDELRPQVITVLGRLGRPEALRERTRTALTAWLADPDRSAQEAAAAGLGALGDPRAIADLVRVSQSARAASVRQAAEGAIRTIQRSEDPRRATAELLQRLSAIEKKNQELEKKLAELGAKLDGQRAPAKGKAPTNGPPKP